MAVHSDFVLDNCRLFDGVTWQPEIRYRVGLAHGRINSVQKLSEASESISTPSSDVLSHIVNLGGRTVMPGLIDAHFHCNSPSLSMAVIDKMQPSLLAQHARVLLENALSMGFTTVRDAGGADPGLIAALEAGIIDGPRLFIAGRAFSQTGGHGDFTQDRQICDCGSYSGVLSQVVDGADQMRRVVREHLRDGCHHIKIFVSGGVLSPTDPIWMDQFTDDEIRVAVEEAQRRRTYVMAHALSSNSIQRCARLGVRSIEHGLQADEAAVDAVLEAGAFIVPTLSAYRSLVENDLGLEPWVREKAKSVADSAEVAVALCAKAGVPLGLGTDLFGMLHGGEANELVLRAAIDGSLAALQSATSVNARIMMRENELGHVVPGAFADLIVVDGDPVADISLLTRGANAISAVIKDGVVVRGAL